MFTKFIKNATQTNHSGGSDASFSFEKPLTSFLVLHNRMIS